MQNKTPCNTLGGWLSHAVARNGISIHRTAKLAGIHHNTLHACIKGETNMRLFNLIAVIGVLAKVENRSPVELMQEAVMSMEDLQLMEQRFQKRKDDSK